MELGTKDLGFSDVAGRWYIAHHTTITGLFTTATAASDQFTCVLSFNPRSSL